MEHEMLRQCEYCKNSYWESTVIGHFLRCAIKPYDRVPKTRPGNPRCEHFTSPTFMCSGIYDYGVPQKHGRLIDADALLAALEVDQTDCPGCPEPEFLSEFRALIEEAPTVIPATEEGNE